MGTHKGFAGQGKESSDYAGASESHNWLEILLSILQCKTASRPSFTTDHIIFYHSLMLQSFGKQTPFKKLP